MPAQRRRRKHRGTQAGTVRRRGRTSRPSSRMEARQTAQQRRSERMNRPPTWRASISRAGIAAAVFLAVLVLLLHQTAAAAIGLAAFMFLIYIPMGFAMDSFVYRVRMRRQTREREE
jgi:hypothetical protein